MRGEERRKVGPVPPAGAVRAVPVRADEGIALDFLFVDRGILLFENLLPHLLHADVADHVRRQLARRHIEDVVTVVEALPVVVAVDEELLDGAPVQPRAVAGEDGVPRVGDALELRDEPRVGHVAGDDHAVSALGVKPLERPLQRTRVALPRAVRVLRDDVDVGHHAELEPCNATATERTLDETTPLERAQRRRSANKPPARNIHGGDYIINRPVSGGASRPSARSGRHTSPSGSVRTTRRPGRADGRPG